MGEEEDGGDRRKRRNTEVMETQEEENTSLDGGKQCHRIISVRSYASRAKVDLAMFLAPNNRLARFYNRARYCYQKILHIDKSAAKSLIRQLLINSEPT